MAMKDRHSPDNRVSEVHNDVHRSAIGDIHGVQPERIGNWSVILRVRQEMYLMNVHRVQLSGGIDNPPMLIGSDLRAYHRGGIRRELFAVDVKAVLVFGK